MQSLNHRKEHNLQVEKPLSLTGLVVGWITWLKPTLLLWYMTLLYLLVWNYSLRDSPSSVLCPLAVKCVLAFNPKEIFGLLFCLGCLLMHTA